VRSDPTRRRSDSWRNQKTTPPAAASAPAASAATAVQEAEQKTPWWKLLITGKTADGPNPIEADAPATPVSKSPEAPAAADVDAQAKEAAAWIGRCSPPFHPTRLRCCRREKLVAEESHVPCAEAWRNKGDASAASGAESASAWIGALCVSPLSSHARCRGSNSS
jgi:hypothetical protein